MNKCYYCKKVLGGLKTKPEHIIPNAVGGKLTSENILCSVCNNLLSDLDQSLANSVYPLTNLFNPKRDNKTKSNLPIKFKYNDREFTREADGKYYSTKFKAEKQPDGKIKLHLDALYSTDNGAKEKALKPLLKALDDIAKSYNWEDEKTDKIKERACEYFKNKKGINCDAPLFNGRLELNKDKKLFLAMLKTAIGFYVSRNNDIEHIEPVIDILKSKDTALARKHCYYFFPKDFYYEDSIYHTIFLEGDPVEGILYCMVSIYGCVNCMVLLNNNYKGETFEQSYCYDLRNHKETGFNNSIKLSKKEIKNILEKTIKDIKEDLAQKLNLFMSFLVQREFPVEEIKILAYQNYQNISQFSYLTKKEYINKFENGLVSLMRQHKEFKYFYEYQMIEIAQIFMIEYPYERYLYDFHILGILSELVSIAMIETVFKNETAENCIEKIRDDFSNFKTGKFEIDDNLSKNKEKYIENLECFIKEEYPKFKEAFIHFKSKDGGSVLLPRAKRAWRQSRLKALGSVTPEPL